jgi:hypothetical protein
MANKRITILTAWGNGLGCGHLQRMTTLLWQLRSNGYPVSITLERIPESFPFDLREYITGTIPCDTNLIIRDMRDSTEEQILRCKNISPVLVLDDRGPGREMAEFALDLLPHFDSTCGIDSIVRSFIYGYSFTQSVNSIQAEIIKKSIDTIIYIGVEPEISLVERVISLIPSDTSAMLLSGQGNYKIINGALLPDSSLHYAEIIMSAKTMITHFGISLFEGLVCQCRLITINPSSYHARLTDYIKDALPIHNLGTFQTLDDDTARKIILTDIEEPISFSITPMEVKEAISASHRNSIQYLHDAVLSRIP